MIDQINLEIGKIYKTESSRVLASLIRILGDLDLAEEAVHDAFSVAMEKWPVEGIPENPYSWLISTGKYKAIDSIRRLGRGKELLDHFASDTQDISHDLYWEKCLIEDDQLRLIFFCCHPLIPLDSRIALALRDVCTISIAEIAKAFLVPDETIKKRITRAKALIKEKNIPYEIPSRKDLNHRMDAVLHVIYLIFNEGYSASTGEEFMRKELTDHAIILCRKLVKLIPTPESLGLLALLLLHDSRREARITSEGDIIPLEAQNRSLWNHQMIEEGVQLIHHALMSGRLGPYTLQAAIVSVHTLADSVENTQWELIIGYYDMLLMINPSPVTELNRAVAVGMHHGPKAGLEIIERLLTNGKLNSYHTIYSIQAEFLKKLERIDDAIIAYQRAIELVNQQPEKRYLKKQLSEIIKKYF